MLFGAKKKPLFGDPLERYGSPQATPGIGDGIRHTPEMRQAAQPTPQPRTGLGTRLFGQGWEDKAFALGGIMQGDPSGVMMMRRDQQMQQQAAADAAAAQRKRAQELADWQWKQEWERDNPKPVSNDTVADYEFIKGQLGEEAAKQYLQNRADPPQYRQGADGRFYRIETGQAPTAPVGKLTPIGGPTQPASGGF